MYSTPNDISDCRRYFSRKAAIPRPGKESDDKKFLTEFECARFHIKCHAIRSVPARFRLLSKLSWLDQEQITSYATAYKDKPHKKDTKQKNSAKKISQENEIKKFVYFIPHLLHNSSYKNEPILGT